MLGQTGIELTALPLCTAGRRNSVSLCAQIGLHAMREVRLGKTSRSGSENQCRAFEQRVDPKEEKEEFPGLMENMPPRKPLPNIWYLRCSKKEYVKSVRKCKQSRPLFPHGRARTFSNREYYSQVNALRVNKWAIPGTPIRNRRRTGPARAFTRAAD
jgi:hypothetical protein